MTQKVKGRMKAELLFLVTILSVIFLPSQGQDKQLDIDVEKASNINNSEYVLEEIDLGENGYLIKTGVNSTAFKGQDLSLYYFSPNADQLWKVQVPSDYYDLYGKDRFVASPDGEVAYDIQIRKKDLKVHHIHKDGSVKKADLSKYDITKNLQSAFCDAEYLYFLSTMNGDELHKSKKASEQLIVHRFKNTDFSYKKFVLQLPQVAGDKSTSFWSFIGQNESRKYLVSKTVDPETNQGTIKVTSFDHEAVIGSVAEFKFSFAEYRMVFVSSYEKTGQGFTRYVNTDEREILAAGTVPGRIDKFDPSLVAVYLDQYNPYIYLMGVVQKKGAKTSEFFIHKNDLGGTALWQKTYASALSAGTATNMPGDYYFSILPNNDLNFGYLEGGSYYLHEVGQDGTPKSTKDYDYNLENFRGYDDTIVKGKLLRGLSGGRLPRAFEYVDKLDGKQRELGLFSNYISSKGEMFTYCDRRGTLRILFYRK